MNAWELLFPPPFSSNSGIFVVALMVKSSSTSPNSSQNFTSMKKKENLYVPIAVSQDIPWFVVMNSMVIHLVII